MASLRLTSFRIGGKTSYGAVTDAGIVDLGRKLAKYPTLLDVFRAGAVGEASAAASGAADYQLKDVTMLPPMLWPEKIICVGINYPERSAEYKGGRAGAQKYPNLFCRFPTLAGRRRSADRAAKSLGASSTTRARSCIVIGQEGRHIPKERRSRISAG